ncbi:hypothetical protein HDU98_005123 [Podochytrium sp. JEL0797]|nr:hypothetical protein HDU98_005120 [Podochytrium sp. JEL0797]KAJ3071584.1 hypothetical protein HDU98_005123 [Podochytrium sp. JEL0797]
MKVVIAGAGLVGAATAIALRQVGHECTLYDRVHLAHTENGANEAVDFGEVGGAVLVSSTGLRVLKSLGVLGEVLANSLPTPLIKWFKIDGSCPISIDTIRMAINSGDRDPLTQCAAYILRSLLHEILIKAAFKAGVKTIVGKKLIGVVQTESSVTAQFADGTSASGDLLIGADGIHSMTRQKVFGAHLKAQYTGVIGYIGVVNLKQHNIRLDERCAFYLDRKNKLMVCVSKVSDEVGTIHAVTFKDLDPEESQDDAYRPYNDLPKHSARLADFLENWGAPAHAVKMMRNAYSISPTSIYDLPDLARYHKGRVLLIGDSAHGMVPAGGLGLLAGLEDVWTLLELFKQLPQGTELSRVLELYSKIRVPLAAEKAQRSRKMADQKFKMSIFGSRFSHFVMRVGVFAFNGDFVKFDKVFDAPKAVKTAIK